MVTEFARTRRSVTKMTRSKKPITTQNRKVQIGVWVDPIVKEELERRAKGSGLSISATANALIARALQQTIDMQYGSLLEPTIQNAIEKEMHSYSSRVNRLLARQVLAAEQTRAIVVNVLGRQPGMTREILDHILEESAAHARKKLAQQTPELENALKEVEAWLLSEKPDGNLN
jgi:post-segregation antitoxin (ccd killing protein)